MSINSNQEPDINDRVPYDHGNKILDMSLIPVTQFQYNTRVMPPKLGTGDQELIIQSIKSGIINDTKKFCESKCDNKGKFKDSNLTPSQIRGRKKLLNRVKSQELVLSSTDKSGKIAIWERDIYIVASKEHTNKDTLCDMETVKTIQNQSNCLADSMCRAFNLGEHKEHQERCRKAMKVYDVLPPIVYFLAKDHKMIPEGQSHPKTRGVCSAKDGPVSRIQNLASLMLGFVADTVNAPTECTSGEIMKRGITDANRKIKDDPNVDQEPIVISLDINALYPSIDKDTAKDAIYMMTMKSGVEFNNIKFKEKAKVLRILLRMRN